MSSPDFSRTKALNNIPNKKLHEAIFIIESSSVSIETKAVKLTAINRYAESNLPIGYWGLKMDKDFYGDPKLIGKYEEYVADIKASYINGNSLCLASRHGTGKTMTIVCVLKKACQKGYSCLYTTLSDMVNVLTYAGTDDNFLARRELVLVDFLAIDEVDVRFFNQSENSNELFAKTFELIIRTRLQNKLPTLIATNSPNMKEGFLSAFKDSLGSLLTQLPIFYVGGEDFRKQNKEI